MKTAPPKLHVFQVFSKNIKESHYYCMSSFTRRSVFSYVLANIKTIKSGISFFSWELLQFLIVSTSNCYTCSRILTFCYSWLCYFERPVDLSSESCWHALLLMHFLAYVFWNWRFRHNRGMRNRPQFASAWSHGYSQSLSPRNASSVALVQPLERKHVLAEFFAV